MEKFKSMLPEACYRYKGLTLEEVRDAFLAAETITGFVETISEKEQKLYVRLGEGLVGTMAFDEVTIYPLTYSTNNPMLTLPFAISVLKEKVICTKVLSIDIEDDSIILSRKASMLEALEYVKLQNKLPFNVTAVRSKTVFGDVGHGIQARIKIMDLCKSRVRSAAELCSVGDSFFVKTLNFDENNRANVSFKDMFSPYNPNNFQPGSVVTGTINEAVDNRFSGFFVNVSPQVSGILDYNSWLPPLQYGDRVECTISRATDKGLHLTFLKLLSPKN